MLSAVYIEGGEDDGEGEGRVKDIARSNTVTHIYVLHMGYMTWRQYSYMHVMVMLAG